MNSLFWGDFSILVSLAIQDYISLDTEQWNSKIFLEKSHFQCCRAAVKLMFLPSVNKGYCIGFTTETKLILGLFNYPLITQLFF